MVALASEGRNTRPRRGEYRRAGPLRKPPHTTIDGVVRLQHPLGSGGDMPIGHWQRTAPRHRIHRNAYEAWPHFHGRVKIDRLPSRRVPASAHGGPQDIALSARLVAKLQRLIKPIFRHTKGSARP